MTLIFIHPSEALSEGICAACGEAVDDGKAWFAISLESVITRKTSCPPLHRGCAVRVAKSKLSVHAGWQSGYGFDCSPEPAFYLEDPAIPPEFDGRGDCTYEGIRKALGLEWLRLEPSLGPYAERMGQSAARLIPGRPVDFATLDLSRPRREVMV